MSAQPRQSRARTQWRALAPLVTTLFLAGCQEDGLLLGGVEPPPIVWEGETLRVGTEVDTSGWCPGNFEMMERRVLALREEWDIDSDDLISYYIFDEPLSDIGVCGSAANSACTYLESRIVATTEVPNVHELAHAVAASTGDLPPVFAEGAASFWGRPGRASGDLRAASLAKMLEEHWSGGLSIQAGEYLRTADFTAYLTETYGLAPYRSLLQLAHNRQSREEFEPVFLDAFGVDLDSTVDDYERDWDHCGAEAARSDFFACQQPAVVLGDSTLDQLIDVDISCANPDVQGPIVFDESGERRMWQDIVVEIPVKRVSELVLFESPALGEPNTVEVMITPCDTPCLHTETDELTLLPRGTPTEPDTFSFELTAGRYAVRISRRADDPGQVRFRW